MFSSSGVGQRTGRFREDGLSGSLQAYHGNRFRYCQFGNKMAISCSISRCCYYEAKRGGDFPLLVKFSFRGNSTDLSVGKPPFSKTAPRTRKRMRFHPAHISVSPAGPDARHDRPGVTLTWKKQRIPIDGKTVRWPALSQSDWDSGRHHSPWRNIANQREPAPYLGKYSLTPSMPAT